MRECERAMGGCAEAPCPRGALNSFCAAVGEKTRRELCRSARSLRVEKGASFSVSSIENEVFVFRTGVCATLIASESGKSLTIYLAEPGFVANVMRVAGDTNRHGSDFNASHRGFAITDFQGCALPLDVVRRCSECDPAFARLVLAQVTDHYKDALFNMAMLKEHTGEDRIAWLLDRLEQAGVDVSTLTHEAIAQLLGMNRVSVTRLMGKALASRNCR